MKDSCSKTDLKHCTASEIHWNKNEDARTSSVVSANRLLPNSLKNCRASLLIGPCTLHRNRDEFALWWDRLLLLLLLLMLLLPRRISFRSPWLTRWRLSPVVPAQPIDLHPCFFDVPAHDVTCHQTISNQTFLSSLQSNAPPISSRFNQSHAGPQKSKPLPDNQKIVLKLANEIRFVSQIKVWIKYYNVIRWH